MSLIKNMVSAQTRMNSRLEDIDRTLSEMKVQGVLTELRDALTTQGAGRDGFSFLLPDEITQMLLEADQDIGTGNGKLELSSDAPGRHAGAMQIVATLRAAGVNDLKMTSLYNCGCIQGAHAPESFRFT